MQFISKWFGGGRPPRRVLPLDLSRLDVPRYPPHKGGFPICDSESCLATQKDLIARIRHTLKMSQGSFDEVVVPVLLHLTDYVHLLPASKNHHHRLVGGLLRHSLEVGYFCAQSANAMIFGAHLKSTSYREHLRQRMLLAAFTLGLIHDVGKVVSDMRITIGLHLWNPYRESLKDFMGKHVELSKVYMLTWNKNRIYSQHELFSIMIMNRIITNDYVLCLTENVFLEVVESIVAATANSRMIQEGSDSHLLLLILKSAEKRSIRRDMVGERQVSGSDNAPLPLPLQIAYKINQLVEDGVLIPNNQAARCFCSDSGVYIDWDDVFGQLLAEHLSDDGIRIPSGVEEQTRMLAETGVLVSTDGYRPNIYSLFFKEKNGVVLQRRVVQLVNELFRPVLDSSEGRDRVRVEISYGTPLEEKFRKLADEHVKEGEKKKKGSGDNGGKGKAGISEAPKVALPSAREEISSVDGERSSGSVTALQTTNVEAITPGLAESIAVGILNEEKNKGGRGVGEISGKEAGSKKADSESGDAPMDTDILSLMMKISVEDGEKPGELKKVVRNSGKVVSPNAVGNGMSISNESVETPVPPPGESPGVPLKDDAGSLPGLLDILCSDEMKSAFAVDVGANRIDVVATRRALCGYLSRKMGVPVHLVTKSVDRVAEVSRMKDGNLKFRFMTDHGEQPSQETT